VNVFVRVGLAALAAVAFVIGYQWWYSPERQIRRVLDGVAEGLSHDAPHTGLAAASSASGLNTYFSPDVTVEPGRPFGTLHGRDTVLAAAARVLSATPFLRIEFEDVQITLGADDRSATVDCTAMATLQDRAGQESVDAREVIITMQLVDGRWVITHAQSIEVLEPLTP
jgi:hypothetical protein